MKANPESKKVLCVGPHPMYGAIRKWLESRNFELDEVMDVDEIDSSRDDCRAAVVIISNSSSKWRAGIEFADQLHREGFPVVAITTVIGELVHRESLRDGQLLPEVDRAESPTVKQLNGCPLGVVGIDVFEKISGVLTLQLRSSQDS